MVSHPCIAWSLCRYIEVDYDLHLGKVHAAGKHVGGDDDADLFRFEFRNHLVALCPVHVSEDDGRLDVLLPHHVVERFRELFGIHENDGLSHLALRKDLLHEFRLFALLAAEFELLNMVQSQIFLFENDLLCVGDEGGDVFLDLFRVGRTEEDVLYLLR